MYYYSIKKIHGFSKAGLFTVAVLCVSLSICIHGPIAQTNFLLVICKYLLTEKYPQAILRYIKLRNTTNTSSCLFLTFLKICYHQWRYTQGRVMNFTTRIFLLIRLKSSEWTYLLFNKHIFILFFFRNCEIDKWRL